MSKPVITESGATISPDQKYRYRLWREFELGLLKRWAPHTWDKRVLWIMLNPSTANATENDPTIRKCIGFTYRWGYGGIDVVNMYAFRATKPGDLWGDSVEPVGPDNDHHIVTVLQEKAKIGMVVVAWGAAGGARADQRKKDVTQLIRFQGWEPMCLGMAKEGDPRHPLMLSYRTPLEAYQ